MRPLILYGGGVLVAFVLGGCTKPKVMNHLSREKSPYLLQHKDNPVAWYGWHSEAFEAAKKENKPIFLSIGYSTCHWCHVMEKESFEDHEVADLLNKYFISIKVDREERPDVDKIYMDAVMATQGHGGWPMSLFLTPDLNPFFAGTYYPKSQFVSMLGQVQRGWESEPEKIKEVGKNLTKHLIEQSMEHRGLDKINEEVLALGFNHKKRTFDSVDGGFGGAPKFPPSMGLGFLMRLAHGKNEKEALSMVELTLDRMSRGGIYDHVGGGFHRYSTDEKWLVPHFEKMLYDNATLSLTYLEAYQLTKQKTYLEVALETLDYVLREMTDSKGGFYSAQDADSEGEEGKFYVWTTQELKKNLSPEEYKKIVTLYGVTENGNFEHQATIFHLNPQASWKDKNDPVAKQAHQKLYKIRQERILPSKDDKIITGWNGLMIGAMAKAAQVSEEPRYLVAAQQAALFIKKHLYQKQRLLRRYREGEAAILATLDDYAYLIQGLLTLYEADFNPEWILWAQTLQRQQIDLLWDQGGGFFYTTDQDQSLIRRSKDYADGAEPNSNAVSVLNLLKLYDFTFQEEYRDKAKKTILSMAASLYQYPGGFSQMLIAVHYYLNASKEIAIIGEIKNSATQEILQFIRKSFIPNKVVAFLAPKEASKIPLTHHRPMKDLKTTIYVCVNQVCQFPTTDIKKAQELIMTPTPTF